MRERIRRVPRRLRGRRAHRASGMKSGIWPGAATESRIQVFGLP
jgi:hypothetical protein